MEYFIFLSIAIVGMFALQFTKEKEITRVSWNKVAEFIAFITLATIIRVAWISFMLDNGLTNQIPGVPGEIANSRWMLSLVFWEDMFYGLPLYFIHKYAKNNKWLGYLKWPLTLLISLHFGAGHMYQGLYTAALLSVYPYFISKKYGERHGFGTVMICHILYDNITFYMVWLLPYLL